MPTTAQPRNNHDMKLSPLRHALCVLALAGLSGCATQTLGPPNPEDPLEASNRAVWEFNETLDKFVLKPVAEAYRFVTPQPIRTCLNNIFLNLGDAWSGINSVLQGRQVDALNTLGRVLLNTTMGLGGCFDIASETGAKRIPNDFGVTLGVWGVGSGPYIVLPILGPSSPRDGVGRLAGLYVGQVEFVGLINDVNVRNSLYGFQVIQRREALLDATDMVEKTALDPYSFVRDAYLQRNKAQVSGNDAAAEKLPQYEDFEAAAVDDKSLGIPVKP